MSWKTVFAIGPNCLKDQQSVKRLSLNAKFLHLVQQAEWFQNI